MQVTVQEAAHRLGVAESTLRRRIKNGEIPATQMPTPQGHIWLVEIPDETTFPEETNVGEVEALKQVLDVLRDQLEAKDQQMDFLKEELEARRREVQELHVLLQRAQAALPAPREHRSWWRRLWRQAGEK
jgi:excisionase family DNA binding protein